MSEVLSVGATLKHGAETPTTAIGGIKQISGPDGDTPDINTSDYGITDGYQTFIGGLTDAGEVTATVKFNPTTYAAIYAIVGNLRKWEIELKDGSTFTFDGYLKMPSMEFEEADEDGLVTNELTIKISGKPTFAAPD